MINFFSDIYSYTIKFIGNRMNKFHIVASMERLSKPHKKKSLTVQSTVSMRSSPSPGVIQRISVCFHVFYILSFFLSFFFFSFSAFSFSLSTTSLISIFLSLCLILECENNKLVWIHKYIPQGMECLPQIWSQMFLCASNWHC